MKKEIAILIFTLALWVLALYMVGLKYWAAMLIMIIANNIERSLKGEL